MRARLALLVAATTSVVLLAFLLPLAVVISRAAERDAVSAGTRSSQSLVPVVASGTSDQIAAATAQVEEAGFPVSVALPDGRTVGSGPTGGGAPATRAATVTRTNAGDAVIQQPVVREDGAAVIRTVVPQDMLREGVTRAWVVLCLLAVALVALSLLVADRLARSLTAPIEDLAHTAERIGRGDLAARVDPSGPVEVREVGRALNRLAARITELLAHERESVADLSHRLRTPVTALRLDAEALADPEERGRLVGDVDELTRQVDALIREARRPQREGVGAVCDAQVVVAERVAYWTALAEDQGRAVRVDLGPDPCLVRTSQADLEASVDSLLGNVIAHTEEGTGFAVAIRRQPGGQVVVTVEDEGSGFPDPAVVGRGESGAGSTGLGLDIARRTAVASGGDLVIGTTTGGGARVTLRLGPPDR